MAGEPGWKLRVLGFCYEGGEAGKGFGFEPSNVRPPCSLYLPLPTRHNGSLRRRDATTRCRGVANAADHGTGHCPATRYTRMRTALGRACGACAARPR